MKIKNHFFRLLIAKVLLFFVCIDLANSGSLDDDLRSLIQQHGLRGAPVPANTSDIKSPLAQLGKRLFFSTLLGGKQDTACVSCHHPLLGGGDNLSLSIGVDAIEPKLFGPGREHSPNGFEYDGGPTVPRNAQSTFNTVFYTRCMFWDCRIENLSRTLGLSNNEEIVLRTPDTMWGMPGIPASNLLEAQASFPVIAEDEMRARYMEDEDNNHVRNTLALRLLADADNWNNDFQIAFNSQESVQKLIKFENIAKAIAAYEASQVFTNNPWKQYVHGNNDAISQQAKHGALLFFKNKSQGGYACFQCHSGDFFTDENFHVLAIPQIGRGKEDGIFGDHDFGRFMQTGNIEDKFAFRTPSLLNVEVTGPYGHTGAYKDLHNIIKHMINPEQMIAVYDFELTHLDTSIQKSHARENTLQALEHFKVLQAAGKSQLVTRAIHESHVDQLKAFLLTLTDPCVKSRECLADWID